MDSLTRYGGIWTYEKLELVRKQMDKSREAAEYAAKKRAALERANQLRTEREAKEVSARSTNGLLPGRSSPSSSSSSSHGTDVFASDMRRVTIKSFPTAERIIIHPSRQLFESKRSEAVATVRTVPSHSPLRSSSSIFATPDLFTTPPVIAAGREYDLSSRPLLCFSSHYNQVLKKREIVFGGADHALYAIQSTSPANHPSPIVKMYSKQSGHSDWVTSVTHLADGRVVSSAMDGKLCLWELNKRRCADLLHHTKSVSKLVTIASEDQMCISASYDCTLAVWNFSSGGSTRAHAPVAVFTGHKSPVVEMVCADGILASGGRDGAVVSWDLASGEQLQRVRGHEAPITQLHMYSHFASENRSLLLSGAADGTIKLWDPRSKELVSSGVPHPGVPVTGLLGLAGKEDSGSSSYGSVVTAGADGALLFFDQRKGFKTQASAFHRFDHARNGIYSLAHVKGVTPSVGISDTINVAAPVLFVGDGVGTLLCYDLSAMTLRYGLGSSRVGAVRCVGAYRSERLLAIGNEDGKCLLYDF